MATFDQIRSRFPSARGLSDNEIVDKLSRITQLPYEDVAQRFGFTEKTSTGFLGGVNDLIIEAGNAAAGIASGVGEFVAPGNRFSRGIQENIIEPGEAKQSIPTALAKRALQRGMSSSEFGPQATAVYDYVTENPGLAAAQAVGSFGPIGLVGKGVQATSLALGLGAKGAGRLGLGSTAAVSGAAAGGDAGGDAYKLVMDTPREVLLSHPQAQALIEAGVTDEKQIYEELATRAARRASVVPAIIGTVAGATGAEKALLGGTRGLRGVVKSTAAEAAGEGFEEGATTYSGRKAAQEYNPDINPMVGVYGSGLMGATLGAGTALPVSLARMQPALDREIDLAAPADEQTAEPVAQSTSAYRPAPLPDSAFEPVVQRGLFDTRGGPVPQAPVVGEQLDLFGGGGTAPTPIVDERQGDLFAPAEATFQTRITAGLLDSLGLPRQSSIYRQLLGKDMADPAQQPQIAELFGRVRTDNSISERTKAGVEGLAMQAFGGLAQQQEMIGPRGGMYPQGRPSTQRNAPGPIENLLPTAPMGAAATVPEVAPADGTMASFKQGKTVFTPAPTPIAAPSIPIGVDLTPDENRAVRQAKAVFDAAETDVDRRNVVAIMQRIIDRASQRSGAPAAQPVTPVGETTAVAAALPAVPVAAGVSSTPATTGAPLGTQAPKAIKAKTQRAQAPAAPAAAVTTPAPAAAPAAPAAAVEETTTQTVSDAIKEDNEIDRVLKAVEAEDTKTDKLFASVQGGVGKAPGRPSLPTQVYAAIRNAIINPKSAVYVRKAKSIQKDTEATKKYGEKVKAIAEAAREFAAAYETYASQNLVRSGEVIKRGKTADDVIASRATALSTRAAAVRDALAKLGEAVGGNAKDVEAIVRFVKDRAQKEKKGDAKTENADITLSRAWTAAKSESFIGEPDLLATTSAEVRQSREATLKGATPQLVDAANNGYATFGKGPEQTGLNGVLNYIRTVGTPFEKILAQAIKLSVAGKAPIKIKFVKEGKSQYDPKTNTITINETSSKEVALHEALHGALQWFVYTNPNATQVVALKTALQRVVNYNGKLPPKAAEVQTVLKKILAGKSKTAELDAVLELVSYGNTLNDFRRALQGMESDAPRTFTKFANDVMDAIYALVRRMLGSSQTVASDVMENTFQLLEAARTATQETAPKKGNVLQVAAPAAPVTPAIVATQVASLPATQVSRLEKHYGSKKGTAEFLAKVQEDIVTYVNKGAQAVAGAIRSIIKTMAEGVLAVGVILNPAGFSNNFDFNLPQTYKTTVTTQVKAEVPANAKAKMSTLAQSVYESMAPTAKASGKGFIVADKPNGMMHVFKADGSMLVQDSALYGKDIGDVESKVSSLKGGAKITPAGKFTLAASPDAEYAGGMTLDLVETQEDGGIIAVHAAYLGDAKENRLGRLASPSAQDNRISYGCVNTSHDTFLKSILPNIDMLNGGMIFVLPDDQTATAAMFPAGTKTTVFEGTEKEATSGGATRNIARKQEGRVEPFGDNVAADSTFDPASGSVLEAAVQSNDTLAQEAGYANATEFANKQGAWKTPTQVAFEAVGLGRVNGKDLPMTAKFKENGAKVAQWVRKNVPTLERVILNFNSKFSNGGLVNSAIETFKFDQNTGYLQMERISQHLYAHPELAKPFLAYMDGDNKALDGVKNNASMKAIADNLRGLMTKYIKSLPANSKERRAFDNVPFSQYLLHPDSIGQTTGTTMGVSKIGDLLKTETRSETSIDEFKEYLSEREGSIDLNDPLYQMFEEKLGAVLPAGFISKSKYEQMGAAPAGMAVDTSRVWKFAKYDVDKGQYTFESSSTAKQLAEGRKIEELSAALLNTTAALSHTYASRNFFNGLLKIGRDNNGKPTANSVTFDTVDEINAAFPGRKISASNVLKVSDQASRSPQIRFRTQRTGTWVQLPENSPTYGVLQGKIIPGPVWNSMIDMHDRAPLLNSRAINTIMTTFKKSKTVYNPGTHVTNVLSNVSLAILHGINFNTLGRATKMFVQFERNPNSMSGEDLALMKAFYNSGAVLGQFSSSEIKQTVYDKMNAAISPDSDSSYMTRIRTFMKYEAAKAKLKEYDSKATEFYAAEDNVFRLAAFLNTAGNIQLRDGTNKLSEQQMVESGAAARNMFLDYDIDARAIRALRQSFLPFVSWPYAAAGVLGRLAIEKPWAMTNMLMSVALIAAATGGAEDEEDRKNAPKYIREKSLMGLGPYMHIRIPFMGDEQNPVYFNLGKYVPMISLFQSAPGEQKTFGIELPGFATPGGPFINTVSALTGYDPFTGKPIAAPTDETWDRMVKTGKYLYDTMAPTLLSTKFWGQIGDLKDEKTGPLGVEKSPLFLARNLGGLGLYQFNTEESKFMQDKQVEKISKDFSAAMSKAKQEEYRKGYPDYEALDDELDELQARLEKRIIEIRGEE